MEVATMASHFFPTTRMLSSPISSRSLNSNRTLTSSSIRTSLSTSFLSPSVRGCVGGDFAGQKIRPASLNPSSTSSGSYGKRGVVTMVIPFSRGSAWEQPPPDLASYLYKNRIVYLGMSLVPSVTELILAEFLYLQYEDEEKPIYLYINSTGTTKGGEKLGYETEAFAIYDVMRQRASRHSNLRLDFGLVSLSEIYFFSKFRQSKGNALCMSSHLFLHCVLAMHWGEAALLLAAGSKGNRSALPSSTIMIKQPIARFQGQATDIEIARKEVKNVKAELVKLYSKHIGKTPEQIEEDMRRPKYFSPSEAVEYGIIDKVLYNERSPGDRGVVSDLKKAQLI
ncbi:hypothetical protein F0562_012838 [Nyssa sinensis]|uniref:ATP-dependent Clp protease proteolytic subunit n=1 Tax=Nyssa sinensis TaxID=561372 RepID=A0A5J4ZTT1_9ASTE|nr:hypothetical protein F0562_012838 [Nyssa sinensis]